MQALKGEVADTALGSVPDCVDRLLPLSTGALKSCLQKAIRFRAKAVLIPEPPCELSVAAPVVAVVAAALLCASKGSFSPELQLFTRGVTAAFKRTAVILLEDGWVASPADCAVTPLFLVALLGLGLATQRMPHYEPPRSAVLAMLRLVVQAASSPWLVAWRPGSRVDSTAQMSKPMQLAFQHASCLLKSLRSFSCDIDMFSTVADKAKSGPLPLSQAGSQQAYMPLCHLVDQHTCRGVAHLLNRGDLTFAHRFKNMFERCTGVNPRCSSIDCFEDRSEVLSARFVQRCCLRFALSIPREELPVLRDHHVKVQLCLDLGVLAAAVGPVPAKVRSAPNGRLREVLVVLGTQCPEDEVVILKPARAARDLFTSLNDAERAEAITHVRSLALPVKSPLLPSARLAQYKNGSWQLDERSWADVAAEGLTLELPAVLPPTWLVNLTQPCVAQILRDDRALEDALCVVGDGLVPGAETGIATLVSAASPAVARRAISMLRQQYATVTMPTPSLAGGLASDQLAAYDGDWDVFRLLALVSRLAPAALRPVTPPNFLVVNATALRAVERWMLMGVRTASSAGEGAWCGVGVHGWAAQLSWKKFQEKAEQSLMEHQRAAVAGMHLRDEETNCGGHFLVMDTGLGKTITSLAYAYRWLSGDGGRTVGRILWVTPKGTLDNLREQLQRMWLVPVHQVQRVSQAKREGSDKPQQDVDLKDFMVNIIHADHLRTAIDRGLADRAPSTFMIFDEIDEMYATTLRTSAARRLCQLCPKFVAQTATPMRKNEAQLRSWLADTCSFPIDRNSLLVAACGMVSVQLELAIVAREEELLVSMSDEVRAVCRQLMSSRSSSRWLEMSRAVQAHTDTAMVQHAVKLARQDRAKYKNGGVLLVADTAHHAFKLTAMCSAQICTGDFASLESSEAHK